MSSSIGSAVTAAFSLRQAFEAEQACRESERRARDEAERRQQQEDLSRAEELFDALVADPAFLHAHKLSVDWRRYTVLLESADFRIRAYFEAGQARVAVGDKRNVAIASSPAPMRSEEVGGVADALAVAARFLADEIQ
jgi:hypothetical protein